MDSCIELKLHTQQTQREVDLQLKANMMLALCHTFINSVGRTRHCRTLRQLKLLTGYGLAFGSENDCVIYKLTMDFVNNKTTYSERFRYHASMNSAVIINAAICYILNRVSTS